MSTTSWSADISGPNIAGSPQELSNVFNEVARANSRNRAVVSAHQTWDSVLWRSGADPEGTTVILRYRELHNSASKIANALVSKGIRPGMRFAVFLSNSVELVLAFLASVKIGSVFVPLDVRAIGRTEEVHHMLAASEPSLLLVADELAAKSLEESNHSELRKIPQKCIAQHNHKRSGWYTLEDLLGPISWADGECIDSQGSFNADGSQSATENGIENHHHYAGLHQNLSSPREQMKDDVDAFVYMMFTSGTSGLPKFCGLTNENTWASIEATQAFRAYDSSSVILHHLPPAHAMGMLGIVQSLSKGSTLVLPSPTFDALASLRAVESFKCTHMAGVPTMLLAMTQLETLRPRAFASLKMIMLGGSVISPDIISTVTDTLKSAAPEVVAGYGLTEGLSVCGTSTKKGLRHDSGAVSMGQVAPGWRAKICAAGSRKALRRGEAGELHICGPALVRGYYHGTNECFYEEPSGERWMMTGDQAKIEDDGGLFILGRYKDIIIRGGENLSPALLENGLGRFGLQAQVIGMPDKIAGEVPVAVIKGANGKSLPFTKIRQSLLENLGQIYLPTLYLTLEELSLSEFPLTSSGKVSKTRLKEAVLAYLAQKSDTSYQITPGTDGSGMEQLADAVAEIIGQSRDSIPTLQPLNSLLDSINIQRLRDSIRKKMHKDVALEKLMGGVNIASLANEFKDLPSEEVQRTVTLALSDPPTADSMVHTHGDPNAAQLTKVAVEGFLSKHQLNWADVEAVFPIPNIHKQTYESMGLTTFNVRGSYMAPISDPVEVLRAVDETLKSWPIFRSFAIVFDDMPLFVSIKQSERLRQVSFTQVEEFDGVKDVIAYNHQRVEKNNVHLASGSPTARFFVGKMKNLSSSALIILANHLAFDALSMELFLKDLKTNLLGEEKSEPRTPYKLYADIYYQHSTSRPARDSIAFNVRRLQGIHLLKSAVWPLQNPHVAGSAGPADVHRVWGKTQLKCLSELQEKQISTPTLMKVACALTASQFSGASEVLFVNVQAGRQWPFLDASVARYLPNPLMIAGMMMTMAMNRIRVDSDRELGELLRHLEDEQKLLTKHCQAPIPSLLEKLPLEDRSTFQSARQHMLNWNPHIGALAPGGEPKKDWLQRLGMHMSPFRLLEWHCGTIGPENAVVLARADATRVDKATVEKWMDAFVKALEWVADAKNWTRKLGDRQ